MLDKAEILLKLSLNTIDSQNKNNAKYTSWCILNDAVYSDQQIVNI
jgi:hypothetical protein